ncbi:MAG: putative Serine/threonine-protein kinase Nek4 [Streblomastix strix]|uniref:Putative Serine/threonine-protein kinase Nek4 n=1 Tax=Streblomastix strix TaxID=222440 RepID=A0A5J4UVS3_9EUKA|nr:MAG: putative Serine/threonine-protein kinase Nek4 [Streblomastix strix]
MNDAAIFSQLKYTFLRVLGQGNFGRVYLVDPGDNQEHAAKVMNKAAFNKRELEAAMMLKNVKQPEDKYCPYIIRFDNMTQVGDFIVILMEYANLPSLEKIIENNLPPPSEDIVRIIAWQLLQGIRAIHSANLMHRDLKPENVLMHNLYGTEECYLKIIDFGLSRPLEKGVLAKTHCGTPLHMAPEVLIGTGQFDNKVDIWPVGVIIYQLLSKKHPFEATSFQELTQRVQGLIAPIPNISEVTWNFINCQMLNKHSNINSLIYLIQEKKEKIVLIINS